MKLPAARTRVLLLAAAGLLLLAFPLVSSGYILRVMIGALIAGVLALGLNIIVGYAGILNIGYVAYYCVGAYVYALLASERFDLHIPFLPLLALCVCAGAALAAAIAFLTSRLKGDYLAVTTLGFAEMVRIIINNADALTGGPKGIAGIDPPAFFALRLDDTPSFYYLALAVLAFSIYFSARLQQSKLGRSFACMREDEDATSAIGIDTRLMKIIASAIGGAYAAVAGALFASFQGFVSPESFLFIETVTIMCMVVLGGLGSVPGTLIGAALLTFLPELLRRFSDFRMLFYGLAFVLFMIFRPQGLVPSEAVRREYEANLRAAGR
ncbi:MAG: branched-chain amino acid ABC transporter permease [Spirochaetales bacterium]|nr:branched-chain amino acid ABC transporter permease [Spirochaetales bacterium]